MNDAVPKKWRKPPLAATISMLVALAILFALSQWQFKRQNWKDNIIEQLDQAYALPVPPEMTLEDIEALAQSDAPYNVARLKGRYAQTYFPIGPRTSDGKPGYHILNPFVLEGGSVVLVNRGWVAQDKKDDVPPVYGDLQISGLFRPLDKPSSFVPQNDPEKNIWYRVDLPTMEQIARVEKMVPLVFYARLEEGPLYMTSENAPVQEQISWKPQNNHRSYALFWLEMGGALLVIFYLRFVHVWRARA